MKPAKRIRVLLTVPHLNRTASPYREMMAISKHLCREEFDLTICTLRDGGYQETGPLLDKLGIPWFVSLFRPRRPSVRELWLSHRAQKEIGRHGPFDIQHSLDFTSSPAEALAARVRSRRYVYNQRNLNQNGHPFALRIKFRLSNRIIAIADHVRDFLLDQGAAHSKLVRIYNGIDVEQVDLDMAPPADMASRNLLLVLGNFQPSKRHEDIIRAMLLILDREPQMRLAIGGNVYDQAYLAELRQLTVQLKVDDKVDFLGGRSDVFELMRQSRALVLCSESEGLPWVILEAMAARLPVIVSDIRAHREVVDDGRTGLWARLRQPEAYAAAVGQILDDPDLALRLTSQARDRLEREFTAVTMVRQVEQMYRGMMASRKYPRVLKDTLAPNQMPHSQSE